MTSIYICIVIILVLIDCIVYNHGNRWILLGAFNMKLKLETVLFRVPSGRINSLALIVLLNSLMILEFPRVGFNWDQTDSVCKILVRYN